MRTEIETGSNCGGLVSRVLGYVGAGTTSGTMRMHGKREAGAVGGVNDQSDRMAGATGGVQK